MFCFLHAVNVALVPCELILYMVGLQVTRFAPEKDPSTSTSPLIGDRELQKSAKLILMALR